MVAATRVTEAALAARGLTVRRRPLPIGRAAIASDGTPLPESTLAALDDLDAWPLGPHDNAGYPELFRAGPAPGGVIRKRFDLYANIRAARALSPAVKSTCPRMDVVVVREDTEGF